MILGSSLLYLVWHTAAILCLAASLWFCAWSSVEIGLPSCSFFFVVLYESNLIGKNFPSIRVYLSWQRVMNIGSGKPLTCFYWTEGGVFHSVYDWLFSLRKSCMAHTFLFVYFGDDSVWKGGWISLLVPNGYAYFYGGRLLYVNEQMFFYLFFFSSIMDKIGLLGRYSLCQLLINDIAVVF